MNILDIVLLLCLIPAVIQGLRKGFIAQVIAIISLVLGGWLSYKFSASVSLWLCQWVGAAPQIMNLVAFILIFALVATILFLAGKLIETCIKIVLLGWLNRLLGLIFALMKFTIIIGLFIIVFDAINDKTDLVKDAYLNQSVMYTGLRKITYTAFPYLKQLLF